MGGIGKVILALAIALAGATAMPAQAVDVVGTSARLRWTPASGPVAAYVVWVLPQGGPAPQLPSLATLTNQVTVNGAFGDVFQVQVAALDAKGVLGPRSPLSAAIRFVATPNPNSPPRLALSTQTVALTARAGGMATPVGVAIRNVGGGSLQWNALGSADWLTLGPAAKGSAPGTLAIGAMAQGLRPGTYRATITVAPSGASGPPQSIQVALTVQGRGSRRPGGPLSGTPPPSSSPPLTPPPAQAAAIAVSTLGLSSSSAVGGSPAAQSFSVRNAGSGTLVYQVSSQASWLTVSPTSGSSRGEADPIRVGFSSSGLRAGTYRGSILVSAPGVPPASVAVTLVVSGKQDPARARPYDLDGDGHADLVTRDASGAYGVTLLGDSGPIAESALGATPPPGATLAGSGDLDGDGKADLVWNDPGAGALQLWLMNGARPSATRALALGGRTLLAVADFDGDGKVDLLLDAGTSLELWSMNGLQVAQVVSGIKSLAGAQVVAAADLDGNGRADLLLATPGPSGTSYGAVSLAGTRLDSLLSLSAPSKNAVPVAAGPCGAGGASGILWHDPQSGALVLQTLAGHSVIRQQPVGVNLPTDWDLVATGDFSGDGRSDLLVSHGSAGPLVVLALDGPSLVGGFQVEETLAPGLEILDR